MYRAKNTIERLFRTVFPLLFTIYVTPKPKRLAAIKKLKTQRIGFLPNLFNRYIDGNVERQLINPTKTVI